MSPAPIALFAYNRPEHLNLTLRALRANPLARSSELHIFSDGPKHAGDAHAVEQVREVIRHITGFARVHVRERSENFGLSKSVIDGVTELSVTYGRVIVLEDDLVVAPGFLTFMNQALDRYEGDARVMQVSGYMFPVERPKRLESTFFCRVPTSWGWATWDRAWRLLERDSSRLVGLLRDKARQDMFNIGGAYPYFEHLELHAEGKMDVWGVRWYASMFVSDGLCLYPSRSLVRNIGMDGTGIHCSRSAVFDVALSGQDAWRFPETIEESHIALESIRSFLFGLRGQRRQGGITDLVSRLGTVLSRMKQTVMSAVQ
jgi:hypothetical protein